MLNSLDINMLIVVGVSMGVGMLLMGVFPYLRGKKVKVDEILNVTDKVLDGADGAVKIAQMIMPTNPAVNMIANIEKAVHVGVYEAEQLYIASQLSADERNARAKETIYVVLKLMGISVNENIDKIVESLIAMECLALGHKTPDEAQIQAEKDKLVAENRKLLQENQNYTDVVNQIKVMVPAIQS